ncbi:methyl-accepting chemotaxis protein [Uliginosibacterium sediminicola]|uniref:Methyl-accepting chemotaxis protein n=1 Tax=Uliginosibacterium sediminicola TaxID=2024550 RepID=A0ABU9Z340_9RHOO
MKTTIAFRLILIIVLSAVVALSVGLVGIYATHTMAGEMRKAQTVSVQQVNSLHRVIGQSLRVRVHILNHALAGSFASMDKIETAMAKSMKVLWEEVAKYEALTTDPQDLAMLQADKESIKLFEASLAPAVEQNRQNIPDDPEAQKRISNVIKASSDLGTLLNKHYDYLIASLDATRVEAEGDARRAYIISLSVIIIGIAAIAGFGGMLVLQIRRTLSGVQDAVQRVERDRDFRVRVPVSGHDELSLMGQSLNRLIESMHTALRQIGQSATEVAAKSRQMADTAHEVAHASGLQSESASGMAAAIEEMTVSISHIGDRAAEADQLSQRSGQLAHDGSQIIGETVKDINEIASTVHSTSERIHDVEAESDKISAVVAVIREVADQTNLLALNAAIEAARAGEQGRGFAVVADEVRKLAERTSNSTRQITGIIEGVRNGAKEAVRSMDVAVDRVTEGVSRAEDASRAIDSISGTSGKAVSMVGEITAAIREQSAASNSIAQQVERIAQMAEVSNHAASNSAVTARELDALAASMQKIVHTYQL